MPKTQQDFLEEARRDIPEVSVEEVEARRKRGDDLIFSTCVRKTKCVPAILTAP